MSQPFTVRCVDGEDIRADRVIFRESGELRIHVVGGETTTRDTEDVRSIIAGPPTGQRQEVTP